MIFRQCIASPADLLADCNAINTRIIGFADANGAGSTYFPVYAYGDDLLQNAAGKKDSSGNLIKIPCDNQHPCSIVAVTNLHHMYIAPVSFAISPDACPPAGAATLLGSGSAAATRAMFKWTAATCLPPRSLPVTFTTHNEHNAYLDFSKGLTDFGITGLEPSSSVSPSPSPSAGKRGYKLAPLTASAVVLAYRAYDQRGPQITNLTLSPDIIAGLFMDQIHNFSVTPSILALNPGISFPNRTTVVARAEYNSETYILNSWLKAAAPNTWKPPQAVSPDIFPPIQIDLKFGERAAALEIVDPPNGFDTQVFYIGLMDSSTAAFYGLPTAKIAMPDGSAVSATSDSILEAINDSQFAPDGTLVPQWSNTGDPDAYPMPMLTYMIAPTDTIDPAKGDPLAKFLRYAVQDGQTLFTGSVDGYARLPSYLVQTSLGVADQIPVPVPSPSPTPQESPSPPPPPLPSESPPAESPLPSEASSPSADNSVIAALSVSQGIELVAIAHNELSVPEGYYLPALLGLTLLFLGAGIGLQVWAGLRARRLAKPQK